MLVAPFSIEPKSCGVIHTTSALAGPDMVNVNGYGSLATINLALRLPAAVVKETGVVLPRLLVMVNSVALTTERT